MVISPLLLMSLVRWQLPGWQALKDIPAGKALTYTEFAAELGRPEAARAAASICARNPVGLFVPCHRVLRGDRSVLLLQRFDRSDEGHRVAYISAMTALNARDGEHRDYSELVSVMRDLSFTVREDAHELFDRVVASIAVGNTDDHLRNHGFLAKKGLWQLSPVFDVNPNPDLWQARSTSIMGSDVFPEETEALLFFAEECGMSATQGKERILAVVSKFSAWRDIAKKHEIKEAEIKMFAESIEPRLAALKSVAER